MKKVWRARGFGDFIIHMMVAEGSIDFSMEPKLALWDMGALIPIITEAGGTATSLDGGDPLEDKSLVTTNGLLHQEVLRNIN